MKKYIFILLLSITLTQFGCQSRSVDPNTEHDHEHVDAKVLITGYSDSFELFAEATPFTVGKTASVLVYLTHLKNFKPLLEGKVTLSLIVGSKGIRQSQEVPSRPGIYEFNLTPDAEGSGAIIADIETNGSKHRVEVKGIRVFADEHSAMHDADEQASHKINTVGFTKEQSWKIDFATEDPAVEPFGQIVKTIGQVQSTQGDEVVLTTKTSGVVQISDKGLLEGESVNAGQQLITISGSGLGENSWNVKYAEARNRLQKAKTDYERLSGLAKDRIVPEKERLAANTEFENAKALFDNMNESYNSNGQSIKSPYGGFVKHLFVKNGQHVEVGQAIVTISQNRKLLVFADVQQKYASLLGAIGSANLNVLHDEKTYSLEQLNGKVVTYGKSVNPDNYLIPVVLQIDNVADFVPGSFVQVYLKVRKSSNVLTAPNEALLEEQGYFFVFVQITPELFEKREVRIGATDGLRTEILSGLMQCDRIVTKGAMLVKLAQAAAALDPHSGHVH